MNLPSSVTMNSERGILRPESLGGNRSGLFLVTFIWSAGSSGSLSVIATRSASSSGERERPLYSRVGSGPLGAMPGKCGGLQQIMLAAKMRQK